MDLVLLGGFGFSLWTWFYLMDLLLLDGLYGLGFYLIDLVSLDRLGLLGLLDGLAFT